MSDILKLTITDYVQRIDHIIWMLQDMEILRCYPAITTLLSFPKNSSKNPEDQPITRRDYLLTLGYMDEDGFIFLKGRMKRMIVRPDGHNVWPSQIEAVILQHPAVDLCAVVGLPAPTMNGKIPTAFIVLKKGYTPSDELLREIEAYSKKYMPERDTASVFRFFDELPMTNIGKVDFRALEEQPS